MNLKVGETAIITTDSWFVAPNGRQYRSVFGTINGVFDSESTLGIKTNSRSTNWYVSIGRMVIAGCQIHYVAGCKRDEVNLCRVKDSTIVEGVEREQMMMSKIYDAD